MPVLECRLSLNVQRCHLVQMNSGVHDSWYLCCSLVLTHTSSKLFLAEKDGLADMSYLAY